MDAGSRPVTGELGNELIALMTMLPAPATNICEQGLCQQCMLAVVKPFWPDSQLSAVSYLHSATVCNINTTIVNEK